MSDTDDTDLLLLIPPDFFLVHSPDLDFDSDCDLNFGIEHDEVKDSIVSDLITQVNDLESRVCMIESSDRSATQYSTGNEDSFFNQSLNSLTESDVLRGHSKDKSVLLSKETTNANYMNCSFGQEYLTESSLKINDATAHNELVLGNASHNESSQQTNVCEISKTLNSLPGSIQVCNNSENILGECVVKEHRTLVDQKLIGNQRELSNEIDFFLNQKKKPTLNSVSHNERYVNKEVPVQLHSEGTSCDAVLPYISGELLGAEKNSFKVVDDQTLKESLPLPEVYQLLKEMEETQQEMERKLELRGMYHFNNQGTNDEVSSRSGPNQNKRESINSQRLGHEKLCRSSSPTKAVFTSQTEMVDRLKNIQDNSYTTTNPQVSYFFPQSPTVLNGEITSYHKKESKLKTLSPNRTSIVGNPIDIVKANLPRNDERGNIPETGEKRDSPRKIANFRRHLNFEKPSYSLRSSISRPLFHNEQNRNTEIEFQRKNENDRFNGGSSQRMNSISNYKVEEKLNSLAIHGRPFLNHNVPFAAQNNPSSSESLHQKMSSNNLLSLSELWNKEPSYYTDDPNKLQQKLEEEKYRRQHCEQQIQALQLRVLEEQEKLAVAIKVDQEKDKAILQITESWRKTNDHWMELEEQRHSLAKQLQDEKKAARIKVDELTKKIERWEKEVSQALDLAADYKDKSEIAQKETESIRKDTEEKLDKASTQLQSLCEENQKISHENECLMEQIKECQEKFQEEEELISKLKTELEKAKKQVSEYEADISVLKEQKESLVSKIKDEKNRNNILERQKSELQQAMNEAVKKEKAAIEEARVSNERIEVARTELRALYQGQLETVVKEKLQEFQSQLEAAEVAMKAEQHLKEKQWMDKANDQCRQLQEKQKLELRRLEESHREEIHKWKVRLMESERLRNVSESKLQEETNMRANIAQKLYTVMDNQWKEALNILSNPMLNCNEMPREENRSKLPTNHQSLEKLKGTSDFKMSRSNSVSSLAQTEEVPFCKEGLITYRTQQQPPQDHQLKKYIQMLLEKGPGNPIPQHDTFQESLEQTFSPESSLLYNKFVMDDAKKQAESMERLGQSNKPPWK